MPPASVVCCIHIQPVLWRIRVPLVTFGGFILDILWVCRALQVLVVLLVSMEVKSHNFSCRFFFSAFLHAYEREYTATEEECLYFVVAVI